MPPSRLTTSINRLVSSLYSIRILINRSYSSLSSEIAPAILIYVDEFAQVGKRRVEVTE
jgi:hypothetical protein